MPDCRPLAGHSKWEVRRAVANVAAHAPHAVFEGVLARLARDDNQRVRQAAEHAALRRRDSRNASSLGKQHEERINATLDTIEARFGTVGREAVKRAAEQMANTYARELYHEVIRLLSPLAASAERLRAKLLAEKHLPADTYRGSRWDWQARPPAPDDPRWNARLHGAAHPLFSVGEPQRDPSGSGRCGDRKRRGSSRQASIEIRVPSLAVDRGVATASGTGADQHPGKCSGSLS